MSLLVIEVDIPIDGFDLDSDDHDQFRERLADLLSASAELHGFQYAVKASCHYAD